MDEIGAMMARVRQALSAFDPQPYGWRGPDGTVILVAPGPGCTLDGPSLPGARGLVKVSQDGSIVAGTRVNFWDDIEGMAEFGDWPDD